MKFPCASLRTYTGKMIDPFHLDLKLVCIEDIAFALSNISRYAGHARLSVAQHSCLVADVLLAETGDHRLAYDGLMHDATEALGLGDIPAPIKRLPEMEFYRNCEKRQGRIISRVLGYTFPEPVAVKVADTRMRITEQRDLQGRQGRDTDPYPPYAIVIKPWTRTYSENSFLLRFARLKPENVALPEILNVKGAR